ncbi:MAG TPA: hypothetical protein VF587_03675 [Solirubrobacteraceae bacterium]|jgi:hypothetical protein
MNVIRLIGSVACCSAALIAPAGAGAAELPLDGTLDLSEERDASIAGEGSGSRAGWVVANAGDFNGDGASDLLIGAPNYDHPGRTDAGAAYIVLGPREGLPENLSAGARRFKLVGAEPGDRLGSAAAPAGDVNGDGLADVIVGAPVDVNGDGIGENIREGREPEPRPGAAYVVFGRREAGSEIDAASGPGVVALTTQTPDDRTGAAVGSVPDMDGDGRPEVVVGAERADAVDRTDPGAAFVVFAKSLTGPVNLDELGDAGIRLDGPDGARAGLGVGGVGDMNGDGRGEILVGAPTAATGPGFRPGAAYVVFGRAAGGRTDLDALGDAGFAIAGGDRDQLFGLTVEGVGDVTGDDVPDVGIGSPGADRNKRDDSGSVHFVGGKASPDAIRINGGGTRPGFRVDGATANDGLGTSITTLDDVNGDGLRELAFVAPYADPLSRADAGAAYVLFGSAMQQDLDLTGLQDRGYRIAGAAPSARVRSVAGLGDVDADKVGDLAVGSSDAGSSGLVDLVLGPKPPATPPPPPDPGIAEELAAGCKAVTNVQIIVDDSFSMTRKDPDELRKDAIELLITKPRNVGKVVGATEFGSYVNQVFPPQQILERGTGSNQPFLLGQLRGFIKGDNGGTNYNYAFASAAQDNPAAQARIFITDGGHLAGGYLDAHAGGPPTFIIGIGIREDEPFGERLLRIADETKGRAFLDVKAEDVIRVMNTIDSALNCDVDIDSDEDVLTEDDPIEEQEVPLIADARTCDLNVSWGDDEDQIEPQEIAFLSGGQVLGRAKGRTLRKVIRKPGRTFKIGRIKVRGQRRGDQFGLRLSGMPAETLRMRYRVRKANSKRTPVTSQITQSRRRNVAQRVRPGVG